MHRLVTSLLVGLALGRPVASQDTHEPHGGHEAIGRVVFPTSCAAAAQPALDRGVTLLHSFWYDRAGDAFAEALKADSTCAMAYWGRAMSLFHPLWAPPADLPRGLAAAERGRALAKTSRERDYLAGVGAYYSDYSTLDHKTRLVAYARAMERVQAQNPGDREAKIFYALALIALGQANATDTTFAYQRRADSILEPLFKVQPEHPGLAHYLIHTNDVPQLAEHALYAARRYAAIAPDVPHAQHMPSHIFTRLGLWDESIVSNTKSAAASRAFEEERHLNALWDQRGHAWDYLLYAYLQEGRDGEAKRVRDEAAGVTSVYPPGSLTNAYALAAIPARYALERGHWSEAAGLAVRPAPEWQATEAITHFARAIGAARSGDTTVARAEIAALADVERVLARAGGSQTYWAGQVKIQRIAATAWLTLATGDTAAALGEARDAADIEDVTQKSPVTPGAVLPARELLGDLLLEGGRPGEAGPAYAATLTLSPNRARSLFGAARAAERAGDLATARVRYQEFLKAMERADGDRPELQVAKAFLAAR